MVPVNSAEVTKQQQTVTKISRRRGRRMCGSCLRFLLFVVVLMPMSLVLSDLLTLYETSLGLMSDPLQKWTPPSRSSPLSASVLHGVNPPSAAPTSSCHGSVHTCPKVLDHAMLSHFLNMTKQKQPEKRKPSSWTKGFPGRTPPLDVKSRKAAPPDFVAPKGLPIRYLLLEKHFCDDAPDIQVIIYVHTAPANRNRREVIRSTWGSPQWYSLLRHKIVFMLGWTTNNKTLASLQEESLTYHDLILADYVDSYRNLSYKALTALHWVNYYCRSPLYVVKTDDDIFINIFALNRFLNYSMALKARPKNVKPKVLTANNSTTKPKDLTERVKDVSREWNSTANRPVIQCLVWEGMSVIRDKKSKWYVDPKEYKPNTFPPYCSGNSFFMTWDATRALLTASTSSLFLWVDDAYLTGVLVEAAKVQLVHRNSLYELAGKKFLDSLISGNRVFLHDPEHSPQVRGDMWQLLLEKEGKGPAPAHAHKHTHQAQVQAQKSK